MSVRVDGGGEPPASAQRRQFLGRAAAALALASTGGLGACAREAVVGDKTVPEPATTPKPGSHVARLAPIRATVDRITGVYVCSRPFRLAGPRLEMQALGRKTVVHNYGHGGSGWSLSWGSSAIAVGMAQGTMTSPGARRLGVIGCGALGLTSAILAQRAGLKVRIYAKALPPDVYSMRASGLWTPDSRICGVDAVPAFGDRWEQMTRASFARYQSLLGLPGKPIEWIDGYSVSDEPFGQRHTGASDEPEYGDRDLRARIRDLTPHAVDVPTAENPFAQPYVRRFSIMMFNISAYAKMLFDDFIAGGGEVQVRDFRHSSELLALPEHTLINCTGYGARALFEDESVVPVRGQTCRLVPQPEVTYGLNAPGLSVVPRSDGIMVQVIGDGGNYDNPDTTPNRAASEAAVESLAAVVAGMRVDPA